MKSVQRNPVLVVEDSNEDFDTVREAARRAGVRNELVHAADAAAARQILEEAVGANRAFSFMLLDQSLPGTNGDGFLREVRAHHVLGNLPVVVLSGSTRLADCNSCYSAGANAYHVKSVRFDEHLATVQDIFRYWLEVVELPGHQRTARVE